jgi:exopolysaccharide biosynthesis polyprenyl glycosylphosphotransferase
MSFEVPTFRALRGEESEALAAQRSPSDAAARRRVSFVTAHGRVQEDLRGRLHPRTDERHAPRRRTHEEYTWLYSSIATTDALCLSLAVFVAAMAETGRAPHVSFPLLVLSPLVGCAAFLWLRLYQSHMLAPAEEFRRLVIGVTLANVTLMAVSFWGDVPYSRVWVAMSLALSLLFTLATRRFWRWAVFRERKRHGRFTSRTAIVGTNEEAVRLASVLRRSALGFEPVGFLATNSAAAADGIRVIGSITGLAELVAPHDIESVFVATTDVRAEEIAAVQQAARRSGIDVHVTANLPELLASRIAVEPLGGIMALSLKPVRLSGAQAAAKRAFDLFVGSLALLITLPIWVVASALVKLTSPGPVLFRQQRVGRQGRPIEVLKLRTMCVDAEARLAELLDRNEADGPLFKLREDPRLTPVGKLFRRLSIDELPQLVNVLRGEMSLVGPRPPLQREVDAYEDWQRDRLEVRPGLTGVWQVSGRSDLSFDEYVRLDLFYIENWSLAFDLYLIAKTIPAVLRGKGAR